MPRPGKQVSGETQVGAQAAVRGLQACPAPEKKLFWNLLPKRGTFSI
jgi:hypothetical protein